MLAVIAGCAFSTSAYAVEPGLSTGLSWERLSLPATHLTFQTSPGSLKNVSPITNHDGKLDDARVDLALGMATPLFGGTVVGVKGFYGRARDTQTMSCAKGSIALGFCDVLPLFDSDPNPVSNSSQNVFGSLNSGVAYVTTRDVAHWGVAFEVQPQRFTSRNSAVQSRSLLPKAGLAFRRIGQDTAISGEDVPIGTTMNYSEQLDTNYWGAYVGLTGSQRLGAGFIVSLDGEAGLYWAHTSYDGAMLSSKVSAGNSVLSLSSDRASFIGAIKLAIDKNVGGWTFGVTSRAEWYSYVPEMNYNTYDRNGAFLYFAGPNDGTSIGRGSAWSLSIGAHVVRRFD
jgi:hypothetical protein